MLIFQVVKKRDLSQDHWWIYQYLFQYFYVSTKCCISVMWDGNSQLIKSVCKMRRKDVCECVKPRKH